MPFIPVYVERQASFCTPINKNSIAPVKAQHQSILSSRRLQSLQQIRIQVHHFDSPDSGSIESVFPYSGSSDFDSADSDAPDELILFQTKMPGWSFDSNRTLSRVQNGIIEYVSIDRAGALEVFHG